MRITVMGEAAARHQPEQATITLNLGFEGPDKAQVVAQATELINRFTSQTSQLRDGEGAPITSWAVLPLGIRSWRPWSQSGEILPLRHSAHSILRLRFNSFPALSSLIDQWGGVEGVHVDTVEWSLTGERQKAEEAAVLAEAVDAARKRAQIIATAAGLGEVRFAEIADAGLLEGAQSSEAAPRMLRAMSAERDESGIDLTPEEIEVSVTVHARFEAST